MYVCMYVCTYLHIYIYIYTYVYIKKTSWKYKWCSNFDLSIVSAETPRRRTKSPAPDPGSARRSPGHCESLAPRDWQIWSFPFWHAALWWTNSLLLKMAIEVADFPFKNGDFPISDVNVYQAEYPIKIPRLCKTHLNFSWWIFSIKTAV